MTYLSLLRVSYCPGHHISKYVRKWRLKSRNAIVARTVASLPNDYVTSPEISGQDIVARSYLVQPFVLV